MAISKVEIKNSDGTKKVLVDLTGDTVSADTLSEGITAHGADGELITGTMKAGIDTSDATAVSGDLKNGKTAYVNGKKITGTLQKATQVLSQNYADDNGVSVGRTQGTDGITRLSLSYYTKSERYFETGTYVSTVADFENFGDAVVSDVAKGKTFTSANGFKVTGTAEASASNDNCEAYQITSASTALNFKRTDGTIKVWGYGYRSVSTYQKTVYAFCGDGYYTGTSYGTPTKTTVTWELNSDGTLNLPIELDALDLIVTKGV